MKLFVVMKGDEVYGTFADEWTARACVEDNLMYKDLSSAEAKAFKIYVSGLWDEVEL